MAFKLLCLFQTLTSDIFKLAIVNDLLYPENFVLVDSASSTIVNGTKSFDSVLTSQLENATTLNGVNFQDYVILNKENVLKEEVTFENLAIEGELKVRLIRISRMLLEFYECFKL